MTTLSHIDSAVVLHGRRQQQTPRCALLLPSHSRAALSVAEVSPAAAFARQGPGIRYAIVAGVMAANALTSSSLSASLGIENCKVEIRMQSATEILIRCSVACIQDRVEMEALTAQPLRR